MQRRHSILGNRIRIPERTVYYVGLERANGERIDMYLPCCWLTRAGAEAEIAARRPRKSGAYYVFARVEPAHDSYELTVR